MADKRAPKERVFTVEDPGPPSHGRRRPGAQRPVWVADGTVIVVGGESVIGPATVTVPGSEARGLLAHGWARKPR